MRTINLHKAKTLLSRLTEEVASGEEIIVAKAGKPVMKLTPLAAKQRPRKTGLLTGLLKGKINMTDDFDAPLPDELLNVFEGKAGGTV